MGLDKDLQSALLKRAMGYDYNEQEVVRTKDGKETKARYIRKHIPPDIAAIKRIQEMIEMGLWIDEDI